MNNNTLVVIDGLSKAFLIPAIAVCIVWRKLFFREKLRTNRKILIIKLMGAGNLVACREFLIGHNVEILTSLSNKSTVEKFQLAQKTYYIDTNSLAGLFRSMPSLFRLYGEGRFESIVNMESESIFAKFITASIPAVRRMGLTNVYRSLMDGALYDRYIVAPMMLPRAEVLEMLFSNKFESNQDVVSAIQVRQEHFFSTNEKKLGMVKRVVIAPSCSTTDRLRRLSNEMWIEFLGHLNLGRFEHIQVLFQDEKDPQFEFFAQTINMAIPCAEIVVGGYNKFVDMIAGADLLLTIDSQALHIAQQSGTLAIAFYGPTSPYGVSLTATTLPITRSFKCSPCTHKYFEPPCAGAAHCMAFGKDLAKHAELLGAIGTPQ